MKRKIALIIILLLAGVALLAYPEVSNRLSEKNGSTAIQEFTAELAQTDTAELDAQRALAEQYNESLTGQNISDPFVLNSGVVYQDNYNEIMDSANHMMAYIEIPKIEVYLPIYHGVSDEALSKGVGHMRETAFPIGGDGNHCVLTGHTGLTKARLFTDLTELEQGDEFYIHALGETLAYEVDQIRVVEPDDTSDLMPVRGEDYVTLITCTPYGVNTQRLLVRGSRVPYTERQHTQEAAKQQTVTNAVDRRMALYGAATALAMLVVIGAVLLARVRKSRAGGQKTGREPRG